MHWVRRIDKRVWWILGFVAVFLLTRLPYLGSGAVNPDGVNWHYRSQQFIVAIKSLDFAKTFQHYHPGVTLMWIMGVPIEAVKQLFPQYQFYDVSNFMFFHVISKVSVVFAQLVLSFVSLWLLSKVLDFKKAVLVVALFSLEPFFVGNSRLLHMDVLFSLFLFNGLLAGWLALQGGADLRPVLQRKWLFPLLCGVFLAMAFLTKSIGVGGILFVIGMGMLSVVVSRRLSVKGRQICCPYRSLVVVLAAFLIATFLLFPALWVKPVYTLTEIFSEAERVGVRKGHGQIILGEYTRDAGFWFYPLVLLMKFSPFIWVGTIAVIYTHIRGIYHAASKKGQQICCPYRDIWQRFLQNLRSPVGYLTLFYLGYFLVMIFPSKKLDRYMIPLFPYLALLAVLGYAKLNKYVTAILFGLFIIAPLLYLYPYYFTYTSPIFGTPMMAHKVLAQKPFGIAVPELKNYILETYGVDTRLGFYDTKPMEAIYSNSKVFDIRVNGASDYDLIVLGPNEEMPEKYAEQFALDYIFRVNGLDYWTIYAKAK